MKKIVIVTDGWKPQISGVVRSLEKTMEILKKNDFEVILIHPGLFRNFPVFFYPEVRLSVFAKKKIDKIITKEKPDFVHIATEGTLGLAARMVCLHKKIKFTTAYHTHIPLYLKVRTGFLFNSTYAYLRWFHRTTQALMVSTQSLKDELELHGFKKIVLCPLGVDTDFFKRDSGQKNEIENYQSPVFVFCGRVAIEKNVKEFLDCDLPGTKLIIGDGPQRKELEKEYGKKAVFVGYQKGEDLVKLLSACDVFVFPSYTDTFGLVVLEALACGVPVAAHNVMGPRDIITHGVDGFVGDDLTSAALACINLSREKCREKALRFSWEESVKSFITNLVQI
ncbi:MAG: glycosyltransferase family 1 protein [Candidatus Magasanikbacteria bacterium]|jgi:glycosyltransferase involved in cell wall biosynthesis